jgi:hypothetical protein
MSLRSFRFLVSLLGMALACPAVAQDNPALEAQKANALPLTPFYDINGADISSPGVLVRSEVGSGYDLPAGVTATRIAYSSRDANDRPSLATGVVLQPPGSPPPGGWPIIAWAHGTAGIARVCAPSLMKDVYYGWEGLYLYPLLGYAVVATDYAGLGSPGVHQYMWSRAQGNDVAYSIPAARAALPSLGSNWVGIGHSQGGYAVLRITNMAESAKAGFLGAIPIASGADIEPVWRMSDPNTQTVPSTIPMMALSIKAVRPEFDISTMVAPAAHASMARVGEEACLGAAEAIMRGVTREQGRVEGWMDVPQVVEFARENRIFTRPLRDPVLLVLSSGDQYIPAPLRKQILEDLCKVGEKASYKIVADVDHGGTINASLQDQLRWMEDRFAGRPAKQGCSAVE